ncbi:sigma-70 family RNA polymerase sigma factor [Streptomyces mirabilis]|uniref:sigma-70 family RNA polymerase sigma factor n=1 Tax=Streptomyces mirabilis TaxID=68239 RepID=UPI0036C7C7FA
MNQESRADEEFISALYAEHRSALLRYVMKTGRADPCAAEDLVQETFLRAWRHAARLRHTPGNVRPWLVTVARNLVIDASRARSVRPLETEFSAESAEQTVPVPDSTNEVLDTHCMAGVLAELSPVHREVLIHLHCLDRSIADTARSIGVPSGTVKSRNYYALRELRGLAGHLDFSG